ncbi:MAG: hypothetical protein QN175_14005, partial [Armatimonadota bacterium]|nr:hypothetical protein [Armatimonadota bacterium]
LRIIAPPGLAVALHSIVVVQVASFQQGKEGKIDGFLGGGFAAAQKTPYFPYSLREHVPLDHLSTFICRATGLAVAL